MRNAFAYLVRVILTFASVSPLFEITFQGTVRHPEPDISAPSSSALPIGTMQRLAKCVAYLVDGSAFPTLASLTLLIWLFLASNMSAIVWKRITRRHPVHRDSGTEELHRRKRQPQ